MDIYATEKECTDIKYEKTRQYYVGKPDTLVFLHEGSWSFERICGWNQHFTLWLAKENIRNIEVREFDICHSEESSREKYTIDYLDSLQQFPNLEKVVLRTSQYGWYTSEILQGHEITTKDQEGIYEVNETIKRFFAPLVEKGREMA